MKKFIFLALMIGGLVASVQAASFDCEKAASEAEKLICDSPELSDHDDEMAWAYQQALAKVEDGSDLISAQNDWLLNVRGKCNDQACLGTAYRNRIRALFSNRELFDFTNYIKSLEAGGEKELGDNIKLYYDSKFSENNYCRPKLKNSKGWVFSDLKGGRISVRAGGGLSVCKKISEFIRNNYMCELSYKLFIDWTRMKYGTYMDSPALSVIPRIPGDDTYLTFLKVSGYDSWIFYKIDINNDGYIDLVRKNNFYLGGSFYTGRTIRDEICIMWGDDKSKYCLVEGRDKYDRPKNIIRPFFLENKNYFLTYTVDVKSSYAGNGKFYDNPVRRYFELMDVSKTNNSALAMKPVCRFDVVSGEKQ